MCFCALIHLRSVIYVACYFHKAFMKYPVKKLLINFGGYTFWGLLFVWGVAALLLKSCESLCYHEVLHTEHSPNGAFPLWQDS